MSLRCECDKIACDGDSCRTEYIEGEWVRPTDDSEPWAVVTFAAEPSPETGHEGWCWWAMGQMGEARSIDDARAKAIASLERFASECEPERGPAKDGTGCDV